MVIKEESLPTTGLLDNATTIFAETSLVKETQIKKEEEINKVEEVIKENTKTILSTPEKDIVSELKETKTETQVEIKEKIETKETPPSVFDYVSKETPHDELPHNLPLRPYESSFVTVPLNEYEKRFASHVSSRVDTMETHKEIIKEQSQSQTQNKTEIQSTPPTLNQSQRPIYVNKVVEAPLEMEDKYLAFIAIVLFILIMFILGYMHINGRI